MERDEWLKYENVIKDISTHTLTWSVTELTLALEYSDSNFNSHAHVERDYCFSTLALYHANFNSHAHVERDIMVKDYQGNYADFNSHAHVERDLEKNIQCNHLQISTHTLTWSVTKKCYFISS